jgi:hypothetical protein
MMTNPWEHCIRALSALYRLRDNWDGEGSAAPLPANVDNAIAWVQVARQSGQFPYAPQVVPGGNGELQLVWLLGNSYLEAEFADPQRIEWMSFNPGQFSQHWEGKEVDSEHLSDYFGESGIPPLTVECHHGKM